uniref:Ig-like domain-containing protein n=1 Tax=Haplochromis burtoni TaxID=8153 RepID=A0A3Q3CWU6_HAPBU
LGLSIMFLCSYVSATEVSCVFMERCILPCSFQIGNETIIWWFKTEGDKLVHLFNYNKEQLEHQDQCFTNRTKLFTDLICRGNASLQLTGVEIQDEGKYNCITHTTRENQESFVNLNINGMRNFLNVLSFIAAPVNEVKIDQVDNRITCWSEGIYPKPQLTWSTSPPSNITFLNTTTVQQTKQLLYNISSSLMFSDGLYNVLFICTISTGKNLNLTSASNLPRPPDDSIYVSQSQPKIVTLSRVIGEIQTQSRSSGCEVNSAFIYSAQNSHKAKYKNPR